ncbi:TspO/MBR family protein [Serinicoccus kebangsaanensis]|uniref:TspO/MBR family protein n=1 Tax=Serinicoccus kebangsaanensis TaxID=2602069 RepID=UPI00124F63C2|nr:TspO/MBR family protein [Serinicoccus kebangsaanensis]
MSVRAQQLLVTLAAVLWIGGTLIGTGAVAGGGVETQGGGLFSDSATLIAPQGPAFSIWSVIYLGLAGYVVWQWLPRVADSRWARVTRAPAAAAIALNGLWLLVVFAGWVWLSVIVMIGIVVSLGWMLRTTSGLDRQGWGADVWVSATFGLYLGWICVATCANIASWLVGLGVPADGTASTWITVAVLAVVVGITARLLLRTDQRLFRLGLAAAVVWGTAWVSSGRLTGELRSEVVGIAAGVTALAVAGLGLWAVARRSSDLSAPSDLHERHPA